MASDPKEFNSLSLLFKGLEGTQTTTTNSPEQVALYEPFLSIAFDRQEIEYDIRLHRSSLRLLFPTKLTIEVEETPVTIEINYPHGTHSFVGGFTTMKYTEVKANLLALATALGVTEEDFERSGE